LAVSTTALLSRNTPVFDWYLMPESYSAPLIYEAIEEFNGPGSGMVLDPFCGTGTTLVASRLAGCKALGIEVNPFLCFASRVKTQDKFDVPLLRVELGRLLDMAGSRLEPASSEPEPTYDLPEMPRLERWITRRVALKVVTLRACIDECVSPANQNVPLLALASILRGVSNMKLSPHAFGSRQTKQDAPVMFVFEAKLRKMLRDIEWLGEQAAPGQARVIEGDIRGMRDLDEPLLPATLAVTSPPYLNNLDYTMQTRLELFFLGFIRDMEGLKQLRKRMMICDAKATYKDIEDWRRVEEVPAILEVAQAIDERLGDRGWGWDYGRMTRQYFGGMLRALEAVRPMLAPQAHFILILGESAHAGVLVPVPHLVAELGRMAGYTCEAVRVLRTRRSSSHRIGLNESAVVLRKT